MGLHKTGEKGGRQFRLPLIAATALCAATLLPMAAFSATNYRDWISAHGGTATIDGGSAGTNYLSPYTPDNAFNGSTSDVPEERYLGEIRGDPATSAYIIFGADIAGASFTLTRYRICRLTPKNYSSFTRAPTDWTLYGSNSSAFDGTWTQIDSQNDVVWTGNDTTVPSETARWHTYVLDAPQTYKFYKIAFTASAATSSLSWRVGVMEIEYLSDAETFAPPYSAGALLVNSDSFKSYDETAYAATEANALSFTGFEGVANSTTLFYGGWWDFGGGNFPTNVANDRTITIGQGAVVTNVAGMPQTSEYYRNKFNMLGASRFYVGGDVVLDYGGTTLNHSNQLYVAEGSSFVVGGDIVMGNKAATSIWSPRLGTSMNVAGPGSLVKAKNLMMPKVSNSPGDCRTVVTDRAVLDVENEIVLGNGSHNFGNRLYVMDGGAVTAATVNVGVGNFINDRGLYSDYEVHVLNGGILRADTAFNVGVSSSAGTGPSGVKIVVSNGIFSVAKLRPFGLGTCNTNNEVRVSGHLSRFEVDDVSDVSLFGMAGGNMFIVENGAKIDFPWNTCSCDSSSANGTVLVTGANTVLTLKDSFGLSGSADNPTATTGFTNRLCIADGGIVTGAFVRVSGDAGTLSVSNGTLLVSSASCAEVDVEPAVADYPALTAGLNFRYGGLSKNCVVRLSGSCPRIVCVGGASADLRGSTKLVFDIPETGYDYQSNDYVPFDVSNVLSISANCEIRVNGLDSEAVKDAIVANGGSMALVRAKTLAIGSGVLSAARATFPKGFGLIVSGAAGEGQTLSLVYSPGFIIIVR